MGEATKDDKVLLLLGEISGELKGIRAQMQASDAATHRRIDDLSESVKQQTAALNRRIDDHQEDTENQFKRLDKRIEEHHTEHKDNLDKVIKRVAVLEKAKTNNRRDAVVSGGSTSAIVTVAVEFIRQVFS